MKIYPIFYFVHMSKNIKNRNFKFYLYHFKPYSHILILNLYHKKNQFIIMSFLIVSLTFFKIDKKALKLIYSSQT